MTRAICLALVASIALAASAAALSGTASAQPNVAGPPVTYQRQPTAPPPVAREPRIMTGRNAVTDAIRSPRFQAVVLNFRVIDESGPSIGSDEVFVVMKSQTSAGISPEYEVDTNDTITLGTRRHCVFAAYDPDSTRNGRWACRREGQAGPILFRVSIYEIDPTLVYNACFRGDTDLEFFACLDLPGDVMFDHTFNYDVPTAVNRTNNQCRCFIETARYRNTSVLGDGEYEVQVRINRVDSDPELTLDPNPPGSAGPVVHRSGALTAALNQRFELDGGAVGAAGDFAFERQGVIGANFRIAPNGGAKIWLGNTTARGYATCFAQRASANYVTTPIPAPAAGTYACYVTSDGRVGELRFDAVTNPLTTPTLTINYTTWQ
jgi:hypothetical protein